MFGDGNGADEEEEETEFDQEDPLQPKRIVELPISFIFAERVVTVNVFLDLQGTVNARQELFDEPSDATIADLKLACLSELARRDGDERDAAWVLNWSVVAFVWPQDQLLLRLTPISQTIDDGNSSEIVPAHRDLVSRVLSGGFGIEMRPSNQDSAHTVTETLWSAYHPSGGECLHDAF